MRLINIFLSSLALLLVNTAYSQSTHVLFTTSYGDIEVELFDNTPRHRDMFLQAIQDEVYKEALFNRVIGGFVNQGGELDELILEEEAKGARVKKRLDPEILPEHIHRQGALGAGRDDNPEKASYYTQIYFVVGKVFTEDELLDIESNRNITIPESNRQVYTTEGGIPHLDGDYTIFGQVIKGMDTIERINNVTTSTDDVPLVAVVFSATILSENQ